MLVGQVGGAGVGACACCRVKTGVGRLAADLSGHAGRVVGEDLLGVAADSQLGCGVALLVEAPGGFPDVFDDVDEVHDDGHRDLAGGLRR